MPITLSLSPGTEAKLRERAAASGQDVSRYASELIEQAVSDCPPSASPACQPATAQRLAAWEAFVTGMREWGRGLPPGHTVDDSRERIYAGRGE